MDALELSAPTQFGLTATPIRQIWVESKTLKCALFGQIRCFPLGQAVLPERHDTSASDCGKLCPLPCTYLFDTLLYKGPCSAVIESCGGRPGLASCTCNGKGNRPFYMNDTKHTETQY